MAVSDKEQHLVSTKSSCRGGAAGPAWRPAGHSSPSPAVGFCEVTVSTRALGKAPHGNPGISPGSSGTRGQLSPREAGDAAARAASPRMEATGQEAAGGGKIGPEPGINGPGDKGALVAPARLGHAPVAAAQLSPCPGGASVGGSRACSGKPSCGLTAVQEPGAWCRWAALCH